MAQFHYFHIEADVVLVSRLGVPTLERALNLDTLYKPLFLSEDKDCRTKCRKVQCRQLFREEVDFDLAGLEGPSTLSTIESERRPKLTLQLQ